MMKFLIFIFVVGFLSVASALTCYTSNNSTTFTGATMPCDASVKYCVAVAQKKKNSPEIKYQTCNGGPVTISFDGVTVNCTGNAQTTTITGVTDETGEYYCCNTDKCNNQALDSGKTVNSATKPFAFGLMSLFVILALLF